MISFFYLLTIPRFHKNSNYIFKIINGIIYLESLFVGKVCSFVVDKIYVRAKKPLNNQKRATKIIVSFTTIDSRIETVPIMLKSIFNQTIMPDDIILWISNNVNREKLQRILDKEIKQGLTVRYVEDIKVHTKYYYAMKEYPNDLIITIDDDILYPENLIESLYKAHCIHPKEVICSRAHEIVYENQNFLPYKKWNMLAPGIENDNNNLIATGVGGVLYPPKALYGDWKEIELFRKLCPNADDIWLKFMEYLNSTKTRKLKKFTKEFFIINNTQAIALSKINVNEGRNDVLLRNCAQYYQINNFQ